MYIVDDPTLALITRFVGGAQHLDVSDEGFLLQQIAAIERYVERFPDDQRQARALEWIEAHAQQYRQHWQKQVAVGALAEARCPDCPLDGGARTRPCPVHDKWLDLLRRYAAAELSAQEYVEDALRLLDTQKDRLKVRQAHRHAPVERAALAPG